MKQNIKFTIVLLSVCALAACTPAYRLQVLNSSSKPLTVVYKIREGSSFQDLEASVFGSNYAFKKLSEDEYQTDLEKRERTLQIEPGQSITLETGPMHDEPNSIELDISEIKLNGENGETLYSGDTFFAKFEQETPGQFVIEYK